MLGATIYIFTTPTSGFLTTTEHQVPAKCSDHWISVPFVYRQVVKCCGGYLIKDRLDIYEGVSPLIDRQQADISAEDSYIKEDRVYTMRQTK